MHCSCLLLFSILVVISNVNAASVHRRGLIPTNINIDIKLGKQSTPKTIEESTPAPGSRKTVINAPFGLGSLTITTSRKNSTNPNEPGKPCNPDTELIETNGDKNSYHGDPGTLGGQGGAFFGPPHPPHPDFGPPPPDYHHHSHYPPPPPHHFHHHPPPPPHHHHPDCHHGEVFPSDSSTKIPETKPDGKYTSVPAPTSKETVPPVSSTTDNVDALIEDIFYGPNSSSSTTRPKIDPNDHEQTGEGNVDIRIPKTNRN